jgi:hypothetical protein
VRDFSAVDSTMMLPQKQVGAAFSSESEMGPSSSELLTSSEDSDRRRGEVEP